MSPLGRGKSSSKSALVEDMLVPRRVKIVVILFQASPCHLFLASISKASKILPDSHRLHDHVAAFCRSTSKAEVGRKGETQSEPMQVDLFSKQKIRL